MNVDAYVARTVRSVSYVLQVAAASETVEVRLYDGAPFSVYDPPLPRPPAGHAWYVTSVLITEGTGTEVFVGGWISTDSGTVGDDDLGYSGLLLVEVPASLLLRVGRSGRLWVTNGIYAEQNLVQIEFSLYRDDDPPSRDDDVGGCR